MVLRGKPVGEQGAADRWTALALFRQARWGGGAASSPSLFFVARTARRAAHRGPGRPQVRPPRLRGAARRPPEGPGRRRRVWRDAARGRASPVCGYNGCVVSRASLVIARQRSSSLLYYLIVRTSL